MNDNINFKPLDDSDVFLENKYLSLIKPTELQNILNNFSQSINAILTLSRKFTTDDDEIIEIERVKRIFKIIPMEEIFIRCKDKIWSVREHIIKKNADYFLNKDYSSAIKKNDEKQMMIESLINLVKEKYNTLSDIDKNFYWNKTICMLNSVARYKNAIQDLKKY